jgi:pimeloyl-ACP methyl ester carboxylesterase
MRLLVRSLATISGPIVLVGHSYGGAVITDAATANRTSRHSSHAVMVSHPQAVTALICAATSSVG